MSEWIDVKDRLPRLDKQWRDGLRIGHYAEVLIFDGKQRVSGSYDKFDDEDLGTWADSSGAFRNVTHWQPLPEPPANLQDTALRCQERL